MNLPDLPRDTKLIKWFKSEVRINTYNGYTDEKRIFIIHFKHHYSYVVGFYMTVMYGREQLESKFRKIHKYEALNKMCEIIITSGRYQELCNINDTTIVLNT